MDLKWIVSCVLIDEVRIEIISHYNAKAGFLSIDSKLIIIEKNVIDVVNEVEITPSIKGLVIKELLGQ